MVISKVFMLSVTALLAACGTCVPDAAALQRGEEFTNEQESANIKGDGKSLVPGAAIPPVVDSGALSLDRTLLSVEGTSSARDLLRKKDKKGKKGKRGGSNSNGGGVVISQPTNPDIQGDNNQVVGGSTGDVYNTNFKVKVGGGRPRLGGGGLLRRPRRNGGVFNQPTNPFIRGNRNRVIGGLIGGGKRKLNSVEGASASRGLLRRNWNQEARDRIFNSNNGGVFVSQPTNPNIQGDNNQVIGGSVGNIGNPGTGGNVNPPSPSTGGSVWTPPPLPPPTPTPTPPPATNSNTGGVFISQPTSPHIQGNGNQVVGGSVGNISWDRKLKGIEMLISQQTNNIKGDGNVVEGGVTDNISDNLFIR